VRFAPWLLLVACDPGGWRVLDTGTDARLQSVYVVSSERILAAGDRGTIIEYDGVTTTVTSTDADRGPRMPGFFGVVSSNGVDRVAGDQGTILARGPKGYVHEDSSTEQRLLTMIAATPSILYAAGDNGRVVRHVGREWSRVDVNAGDAKITGAWAISAKSVAFTTDRGQVIDKVADGWVTTRVDTGTAAVPLFGVWSSTTGADTYAVGLSGAIFKRTAGDDEFELEASAPGDLYAIFGVAPDRIWAVGANGSIMEWDGIEWRGVPSGTSQDLFSIHGTPDGSFVAAAGSRGAVVILQEED
jgi:hypothetical protein